jgi:sugar (pentulose or hexulose) kinase
LDQDRFIGIDVGTSGCRAVVIDADGTVIESAATALPPSQHPLPGYSEQQPGDWWRGVLDTVRGLTPENRARCRALCIDATSSTLLLSDRSGNPLTPGLMYDDRRAGDAAALIARYAPPESPARGAGSALSKLLHLVDSIPSAAAAHALHQADWLSGRLTGRYGIADENNALKLGYDPAARAWPAWLRQLAFRQDLLPDVVPAGTGIGTIGQESARQLGLPQDLLIAAGTTDSIAATLAAGRAQTGVAVTSLGSTLALKVWCEGPVNDARFGVYSHRLGDRWLAGGASNSGGAVLRRYFSDAELRQLSAAIDPDQASGLDYYPLLSPGERFPVADPEFPPRLEPLVGDRNRLLHGLLEGIANIERQGYRRLAELGAPYPSRVYTAGGGAGNDCWSRIRRRLLGVPVVPARQREAAYGAATLARQAANRAA